MDQTNDATWLAFEALAKTYPHDDGVRITADLARWLVDERKRASLQVAPIIEKAVAAVTPASAPAPAVPLARASMR